MVIRPAGGIPGRALLAGALASLGAFIVLTAVVLFQGFDGADHTARAIVQQLSQAFRPAMEAASFLGGEPGQLVIVCLASAVLWRRAWQWGVAFPVLMAGAGLLQLGAKWAIDRPRPNLDAWGFPSAHVLTVVVLFGLLAYVAGTSRARRNLGVVLWAAIVATVALSRMYLDAHWLSDVLGGLTIGIAYLLGAIWLLGQNLTITPAVTKGPESTSIRL
jgi:undecaprenyl-diphosphatase